MNKIQDFKIIVKNVFENLEETQKQMENHIDLLKGKSTWTKDEIPELSTVQRGKGTKVSTLPIEDLLNVLTLGSKAMDRFSKGNDISEDEKIALESIIILYGRPALLIQDDDFSEPPLEWQSLKDYRSSIQKVLRGVGRVELENHPTFPWVGTGFLAGPEILITNRHVAMEFTEYKNNHWNFIPKVKARVDYKEEYRQNTCAEFELEECLGIHQDYDLAIFKVAKQGLGGEKAPEPLTISKTAPDAFKDLPVYVVGYPAWDGRRNDPIEMLRMFKEIFDVKRLQPGKNTGLKDMIMSHDCSTLGGNSGSCVVDLKTGKVIGLHYGGQYLKENVSIPLWKLVDDPLLKKYDINWG